MRRTHQLWVATVAGVLLFVWLWAIYIHQQQEPSPPQPPMDNSAAPCRRSVTLTDGTFTFHLNLSLYQAHFPHLQSYQCREVIPEADLCNRELLGDTLLFLLAIKSHPASSARRATARHTWAQPREVGGYRVRPVFLVALTSDSRHRRLVQLESSVFRDILLWDFMESHHNLSLKELCFLHWVHQHCQQATYILKGKLFCR